MNTKTASKQLNKFITKIEEFCRDNSIDLHIENGDIYVYKYFYDEDGEFTHIKRIINTAPF